MADIFISYANEDRGTAQALAEALRERWTVWWDRELLTGDEFRTEIERELASAGQVVVLWSRCSITRKWVTSEASNADARHVLFPVKIEDVTPPQPFEQTQTLVLLNWSGAPSDPAFQKLVADLNTKIQPRKRALLVGVGSYQKTDGFKEITSAAKNVRTVEQVLKGDQGCGFGVSTLFNPECKELQIRIEDLFKQADPGHLLLFYFCGHAKLSHQGELYLCGCDAELSHLDSTAIALAWLANRAINQTRAAQVVILFDCVYSGVEAAAPGADIAAILQQNLGSGKPKYLFTASTMADQDIVRQGEDVSLLARWFAHGVLTFDADISMDNVLTADEICRYLKERINQEAPALRPGEWGFNVNSGEGEIARRAKPSAPIALRLPTMGPFFTAIRAYFAQKRVIPFLGDGIHTGGPLGSFELVGALVQSATQQAGFKVDERYPLATAGEYLLQVLGADRTAFLAEFRRILNEKSEISRPTATHDLIQSMQAPWLVVSATYDWTLEQLLAEAGQPFAVVAHVVHAADPSDEGKFVVLRWNGAPSLELRLADNWVLSDLGTTAERVIYKLVGSPYLHDYTKPEQGLDTVVVTETDHMKFLGRLQNEHTCIPTAFAHPFKVRALLFLGYNLDVWHYRLLGHIFSEVGPVKTGPRFAVRTATSPIEEKLWTQLVSTDNRLQSDCEAFVLTLRGN